VTDAEYSPHTGRYKEQDMIRPNPLQWIWYTFGGRLGPIYSGWVLYDTTCRTRGLREVVRAITQVVLPGAVLVALFGDNWIVWTGLVGGLLMALFYSLAYMDSFAERRLVKHGYEPGTLKRTLRERVDREQADRICRYMEMYRS
jgi:hypothetical protein